MSVYHIADMTPGERYLLGWAAVVRTIAHARKIGYRHTPPGPEAGREWAREALRSEPHFMSSTVGSLDFRAGHADALLAAFGLEG